MAMRHELGDDLIEGWKSSALDPFATSVSATEFSSALLTAIDSRNALAFPRLYRVPSSGSWAAVHWP
jgi:hypothetical protein